MTWRFAVSALCLLALLPARARPADPPPGDDQGTYLGALFGPVSDRSYRQRPTHLSRNRGVLITHVLPDSPADKADLHRDDVLLTYGGVAIRDCEHLATLIRQDRANHKVKLALLRGDREATAEVTLGRGPAIKVVPKYARDHDIPRGIAKPNGPAGVSVAATPLEKGRMKVTIEYQDARTGRYRSVTCQGGPPEIDSKVRELPRREQNLVRLALERIRELNTRKTPTANTMQQR